jgi:hypothetical protein
MRFAAWGDLRFAAMLLAAFLMGLCAPFIGVVLTTPVP